MKTLSWRVLMLLSGVALLQGCVVYPAIDEPYYGGWGVAGPVVRYSGPVYEVHEHRHFDDRRERRGHRGRGH